MSTDPHDYMLRVTAGPSYSASTHVEVPVNAETSIPITNAHCTSNITIRVQNYRGLPDGSPQSTPYFSDAHKNDMYSIGFSFIPHQDINGDDLVFGNDFDRPVRDRLPPGFNTAFRIVKWGLDPGLDGDVQSDKPYLYGPLLSSINTLRIGPVVSESAEKGKYEVPKTDGAILEGADDDGAEVRSEADMPDDSGARKKFFLKEEHRLDFDFEKGRVYHADFFNPYLDFNEFALKLPGFSLGMLRYLGGKGSEHSTMHDLRYVCKNRKTGDVLFVVVFTLLLKTEVEELRRHKPISGTSNENENQNENQKPEGESDGVKKPEDAKTEMRKVPLQTNDDDEVD